MNNYYLQGNVPFSFFSFDTSLFPFVFVSSTSSSSSPPSDTAPSSDALPSRFR